MHTISLHKLKMHGETIMVVLVDLVLFLSYIFWLDALPSEVI